MQLTASASRPEPIVGRDYEQEKLRHCLSHAIEGRGSFVMVSGVAGIGKTTLVRDLIHQANERGCVVLTGGCYDLTTTPPYGPWLELARDYPVSDDLLTVLPEHLRQSSDSIAIGSQAILFDQTNAFFANVSSERPLVLILEDLHWSDPASLELLRYLARTLSNSAVLLIVTYRDDELARQHPLFMLLPLLTRESNAIRLNLQQLTSDDIRDLVFPRGLAEEDLSRLVAYLRQRAGGNPLFTAELLRALETDGTFSVDGGRIGNLDEGYLPTLVLQVIERRLAHFGDEARRFLEIAAVIGQDIPLDLWETVSGSDQGMLDTTLEQAFQTHILEETDNHQGVRFTHALIREVLYTGVLLTRRRIWHRNTADALMASPEPDPDAVAFHLEQAGAPRLVDWLVRAAERAERRQAQLMAADQFDRAQALLTGELERATERSWLLFRAGLLLRHSDFARSVRLFEEAEAVALTVDRPDIAYLARSHQGLVRSFQNDVRRGLDDMRVGVLGLEQISATDRARLNLLEQSLGTGFGVQGRGTLALHLAVAGQFREAERLLDDWPRKEWERSPDAFRTAGRIHARLGQPDEARQAMVRSRSMYQELNDLGQAGVDALDLLIDVQIPYAADDIQARQELTEVIQALWARDTSVQMPDGQERYSEASWALEYFLSGDWDRADEMLNRLDDPSRFIKSSRFDPLRLQIARYRGNPAMSWARIHRYLPEGPATEPGECRYPLLAEFQPVAVEMALDAGQLDLARAWLEAHDRLLDWSDEVRGLAQNRLLWARFHLAASNLVLARQYGDQALTHASAPRQPLALVSIHRLFGELETQSSNFADAERHLQTSLDLAAACGASFERALTLFELACLYVVQHQVEAAYRLLQEVRTICEPLRATPMLEKVTCLSSQSQARNSMDTVPFGLTPRELEVLRLVAEGMTDPQVAERLFLSPRTVSSHLTSIYTKLNVSSRAAATRIAVEQALL